MLRLVAEAYALAARAHAGQRLKGDRADPFVNHPCRVAALAAEVRPEPAVVVAAVLHDVVEDSSVTIEQVEEDFGDEVAEIVGWLTDAPEIADLPTDERKARQAEKMADAPCEAKIVKLADQLDNIDGRLEAFDDWPLERHRLYLSGARLVVEACRAAAPCLGARFDAAAAKLAARLEES